MAIHTQIVVFTTSARWYRPDGLLAVDVVLRGAGGSGSTIGGGGGAAVDKRRILAMSLGDYVDIVIGVGSIGMDGGRTAFGDVIAAEGGIAGVNGGAGGLSYMRGGRGGTSGSPGESVTSDVVRLLAGGGGGAGLGSVGGRSGLVTANQSNPPFWQWLQSGGGGNSGQPGGFPAGGGGANARGANGVCTVIEYYQGEAT